MTRLTHGRAHTSIYNIWSGMIGRCSNPNNQAWANYGGRGITVCARWRSFENFLADMGERPRSLTLDRIDNEKGYSPENCRWADRKTQSRNQRGVRLCTFNGEARTLSEWAEIVGLPVGTLWRRLAQGWTEQEAISTPKLRQVPGLPRSARLRDAFGAEHGVRWSQDLEQAA